MANGTWVETAVKNSLTARTKVISALREAMRSISSNGYCAIDIEGPGFDFFGQSHIADTDAVALVEDAHRLVREIGQSDNIVPVLRIDYGWSSRIDSKYSRWRRHGPVVLYLITKDKLRYPRLGRSTTMTLSIIPACDEDHVVHKFLEFSKRLHDMDEPFSRNLMYETIVKTRLQRT